MKRYLCVTKGGEAEMKVTAEGPYVLFADVERELAEARAEIAALKAGQSFQVVGSSDPLSGLAVAKSDALAARIPPDIGLRDPGGECDAGRMHPEAPATAGAPHVHEPLPNAVGTWTCDTCGEIRPTRDAFAKEATLVGTCCPTCKGTGVVRPTESGDLWAFLKDVLSQGAAIHQDYRAGNLKTFDEYMARLDAAACERATQFTSRAPAERTASRE